MSHPNREFWLHLLKLPEHAKKQRLWNGYLAWKLPEETKQELGIVNCPTLTEDEKHHIAGIATDSSGLPRYEQGDQTVPYMNFADEEFSADFSFAGLIFVQANFNGATFDASETSDGINFQKATFVESVNFSSAQFLGSTDFNEAVFRCRTRFDGSRFRNTVYFNCAAFCGDVVFNNSTFGGAAYFQGAKFSYTDRCLGEQLVQSGGVGFKFCKFRLSADFKKARFEANAFFDRANFRDSTYFVETVFANQASFLGSNFAAEASFSDSRFKNAATFHDAHFHATTSFRRAQFHRPPGYFQTRVHEDTDFSEVDWSEAERRYTLIPSIGERKSEDQNQLASRLYPDTHPPLTSTFIDRDREIDHAIRAWERLAVIMNGIGNHAEEHKFFRFAMRARRFRSQSRLFKLANWLFEVLAAYGWSVRRSLGFWSAVWLLPSLLFACRAHALSDVGWWPLVLQSMAVSFSNAHAFLGLGSQGGYLREAREGLLDTIPCLLTVTGTFQAVFGPILLFLLLLTLRNRFRIR